MKKKSPIIGFACVAALLLLSGCASTKSISLAGKSPMAVISVIGTNLVSWQEQTQNDNDETLSTDGAFNALLNKAIDSKNPEIATAVDRLDYADESFRRIMSETAGLQILDKSKVVDTDIYEYTRGSFYNSLSDSVCATGYKDMTVIGAKKARMLESELGAKSLASMDFSFKKTVIKGNRQNGKLAAATLPEPMASIAVANGCRYVTGSDELGINPGVIMFTEKSTQEKKASIQAMYRAYNKAVKYLNETPQDEYMDLVIEKGGFPQASKEALKLPKYHEAALPKTSDVTDCIAWLKDKGLIQSSYSYNDLVLDLLSK